MQRGYENEVKQLKLKVKFLQNDVQCEKDKNATLIKQIEEKLKQRIKKKEDESNLEISNLNNSLDNLNIQMKKMAEDQKVSLENELKKQEELQDLIKKEKRKNEELFDECENLKKNLETLKENLSEVDIERDFLKSQQENVAKIVDENKSLKFQLDDLLKNNEELAKEIEGLKEEQGVTKSSHNELLQKLNSLQNDNDILSVMLEGLKSENVKWVGVKLCNFKFLWIIFNWT